MVREKLSESERAIFTKIKARLDDGFSKIFQMGEDLLYVRDKKLYREDYDTWDEFVRRYYGYTVAYVNRLIIAAQVHNEIAASPITVEVEKQPENNCKSLQINTEIAPIGVILQTESQARQLAKAPPGTRAEVLQSVSEKGPVTAKSIAEEVAKRKEEPPAEVEVDKIGRVITEEAMNWWKRREEVSELINLVSKLRSTVAHAYEEKDRLYSESNEATLVSSLNAIYSEFKRVRPYALCPICQGHPEQAKCTFCGGKGLISEFRWNTAVAQEIKDMILKQVKSKKAA